jgi:hypothetical protein
MSEPANKKPRVKGPGPRTFDPSVNNEARRAAGAELMSELLQLYARCKLSAKDFANLCRLCRECGCIGAAFADYAYSGDQAQRHLDKIIPRGGEMLQVSAPMNMKKNTSPRGCQNSDESFMVSHGAGGHQ